MSDKSSSNSKFPLEQILKTGRVTRREHFQLVSLFLSDLAVSDRDRKQINQIFDNLQMGKLHSVEGE
ncbi:MULTISPECIES: hypothetical protein [Spirulina sp. CCY15215]|uniref:hypothetical protein n=1 Tax=Spirulina sp. CCY15215 TaxID=2767591 RepID=UPI00194E9998|nr:hypothetical protein [Spirulina major]